MPQSRIRHWGSDNPRHKGADYFGAAAQKRAGLEPVPVPAVRPAAAAKVLAEAADAGAGRSNGHPELPVKLAK
jgi:hypothetical protein